jgi:outer membrane protein assembly factor BamB
VIVRLASTVLFFVCAISSANDWTTYRNDISRSGVTTEALVPPLLESWTFKSVHAPRPAWPEPAKQDFWGAINSLSPTSTFDCAFQTVASAHAVYFASSADDTLYCLDAASGRQRWTFTSEGPMRLAPVLIGDSVIAGSDDGAVYCLNSQDGVLKWKYRAAPQDHRLPGNERIISLWPVRCGIVADRDTVYFSAGLFPSESVFLCAVNAKDGHEVWKNSINSSTQGYLAASATSLFLPTGRTAPAVFDRVTGKQSGGYSGSSGDFALVVNDMAVHGTSEDGNIHIGDPETLQDIVSLPGRRMVATPTTTYILQTSKLLAIERVRYLALSHKIRALKNDRERTDDQDIALDELEHQATTCRRWTVRCPPGYELILAGETLYVGGENKVYAYDANDSKLLWTGNVNGNAYGLAVSNGRLLVSTDSGSIYCFKALPVKSPQGEMKYLAPATAALPEVPSRLYANAAEVIVKIAGMSKGYCLVHDAGIGQLAYEIATRSEFQVIGMEEDTTKIAAARRMLTDAQFYGVRVSMHQRANTPLPYQKYFANLIVSSSALETGPLPASAEDLFQCLAPCGGVLILVQRADRCDEAALIKWGERIKGWKVEKSSNFIIGIVRRETLGGSGEWTHFYGDIGNTACSRDALAFGPMEVQWFGRPGPRGMVDRHHRSVAPLYKDGRMFISGDNAIVAMDAYNGTIIWERAVPKSVRLVALKDCGNMVLTDEYLYVASGSECRAFDVKSGEQKLNVGIAACPGDGMKEWGYIGTVGEILLGSGTKPNASRRTQSAEIPQNFSHYDLTPMICSDYLFALDRRVGTAQWTYFPPSDCGVIVNSSIVAGGGRVYFVESADPATCTVGDGRIKLPALLGKGSNLVALDLISGRVVWKKPSGLDDLQHILHVLYSNETLITAGSKNVSVEQNGMSLKAMRYDIRAFDAASGGELWRTLSPIDSAVKLNGDHGEQDQHPAIVGDTVYTSGLAYSLHTGEIRSDWKWKRGGFGCGTISASACCLFNRGNIPQMTELKSAKQTSLSNIIRPGCWINMIPAGGMVLIPEASSGCTCPYSIQTSMALVPR